MGFIRKVYGILTVQLLFTCAFCLLAMNSDTFKEFLKIKALLVCVVITYIVSIIALICCKLDTKVPANFILLAIFTFCVSWLVALCCTRYNPIIVFEAASLTFACVLGLTVYAITTKSDFTQCGDWCMALFFVMVMVSVMGIILSVFIGPAMRIFWCMLGVCIFSIYIIIDTQMIVGGKGRFQYTED